VIEQIYFLLDKSYTVGYTFNMKTAISIDKQLYEEAEKFSKNAGLSRSKLYSTAINEYIQNHSPDLITEKLNEFYKDHESKLDDDLKYAAYRILNREDW
jgi:antitoxin component of RelBE/YafQ-DinJ toxin-antitoxin module